jgi:hypothetical protein
MAEPGADRAIRRMSSPHSQPPAFTKRPAVSQRQLLTNIKGWLTITGHHSCLTEND